MKRFVTALFVLAFSLACAGGGEPSELAKEECTPSADATACEKCFVEKCAEQCMSCVDDPACYACGQTDELDPSCSSNPLIGQYLTCVLTADCAAVCAGEPPPSRPPRVGKARRGGRDGKAAKSPRGARGAKGGKHKNP